MAGECVLECDVTLDRVRVLLMSLTPPGCLRQTNLQTFISAHCVLFVDKEEFDHHHYAVFKNFSAMVESMLEATLSTLGASPDAFAKVMAAPRAFPVVDA